MNFVFNFISVTVIYLLLLIVKKCVDRCSRVGFIFVSIHSYTLPV